MKHFISLSAVLAAAIITLNSCGTNGLCVKGSGPVVSETRVISPFTCITLEGSADIYIRQDSVQSVVVEAQSNILQVLDTKVMGNHLSIGFEKHCVKNHEPIKVYISVPDIEDVSLEGSGNIFGNGVISVNSLSLDIEGSGDIEMENLQVNELHTSISGSGNATYSGTSIVQHHSIDINGSGKIKAFELTVNSVDVDIDGSGECRVKALQSLDVNISGSGDVYYQGNPGITSNISGSGNIINAN